jgi:hypothetical protein
MADGAFPPRSCTPAVGVAAFLAIALLGCGLTAKQKLAVSAFSRSTVTLGEATSAELKVFRTDGIEANAQVLLLRGEVDTPGLPKVASLDRGYELARIQPILRAADALAAYGKTLAALAGDSQAGSLQKAGTDLLQSLGPLPGAETLGPGQADAFGTVTRGIGGWWTGPRRKRALVALVEQFDPALDRLCDRLVQDFSAGPTRAKGWVYLQLQLATDRLEAAAFDRFNAATTYATRKEALDAYRLAGELRAHRDEACSRISGTAAAMKKAHSGLLGSLQDGAPAMEDLQAFVERAGELQSAMTLLLHP